MKVLISPVSLDEVALVSKLGVDVVDLKNTDEGSLGAAAPWMVAEAVRRLKGAGIPVSAALGDLSFQPGTAALAALGAAHCGVDYVKAGLRGVRNRGEAVEVMRAVRRAAKSVRPAIRVVAAGYGDHRRFDGLSPAELVEAARESRSDAVLLDTWIKDGSSLFEALSPAEIRGFVEAARRSGLEVALAGSIDETHLARLREIGPDFIGVRGALCDEGDRRRPISLRRARRFLSRLREPAACGRTPGGPSAEMSRS